MLYWILHSFDLLGIAIDQQTKDRCVPLPPAMPRECISCVN